VSVAAAARGTQRANSASLSQRHSSAPTLAAAGATCIGCSSEQAQPLAKNQLLLLLLLLVLLLLQQHRPC
jgi:hypothetical protein